MTNAEKYVLLRRDADALWSGMTAEEHADAERGVKWLQLAGQVYTGPKLRGRPPGSKNRKAEAPHPDDCICAFCQASSLPSQGELP